MLPILHIKAKTIHMQKPMVLADGTIKRLATIQNKFNEGLITKEAISRKTAYKNTNIKTGESFFDDSDMNSDYYLVVVYDQCLNIPLLTARYYYDKAAIAKCLRGDDSASTINPLEIQKLIESKLFLSDRLSGNVNSPVYRKYRHYIFLLFYLEMLIYNRDSQCILMARKEKYDKLMKKYVQIGLNIIGSNTHKGKEHWILLGKVKICEAQLKLPPAIKALLIYKNFKK